MQQQGRGRLVARDGTLKSVRDTANLFATTSAAATTEWRYPAMENIGNIRGSFRR